MPPLFPVKAPLGAFGQLPELVNGGSVLIGQFAAVSLDDDLHLVFLLFRFGGKRNLNRRAGLDTGAGGLKTENRPSSTRLFGCWGDNMCRRKTTIFASLGNIRHRRGQAFFDRSLHNKEDTAIPPNGCRVLSKQKSR